MTRPFALDDDGRVTVVGPPGLQCFLGADEATDDGPETADKTDQTDER